MTSYTTCQVVLTTPSKTKQCTHCSRGTTIASRPQVSPAAMSVASSAHDCSPDASMAPADACVATSCCSSARHDAIAAALCSEAAPHPAAAAAAVGWSQDKDAALAGHCRCSSCCTTLQQHKKRFDRAPKSSRKVKHPAVPGANACCRPTRRTAKARRQLQLACEGTRFTHHQEVDPRWHLLHTL
jgi:hypothetical protein